jgi:hypothetical protein
VPHLEIVGSKFFGPGSDRLNFFGPGPDRVESETYPRRDGHPWLFISDFRYIVNCLCLACSDVMCSIDVLNMWLKNRLPTKDMASECMVRKTQQSSAHSKYNIKYPLYFILVTVFVIYHFLF